VPYVFLAATCLGAVTVLNAYFPLRKEPLTVFSFFAGWLVGEMPIQTIAWEVLATVLFGLAGAFSGWAGWAGLAIAVVSWAALAQLAVIGHRTHRIVADALAEATGSPAPLPGTRTRPLWSNRRRMTIAVPFPGRAIEVVKNIDYFGDGTRRHRLDIIRPRNPAPGAPVMIYIHGGAWIIGDKREQGKPMLFELAHRGWVCVTINYRLSPKATWPEHIIDCKKAIAWVREHIAEYGGDPSFIALSGGSAGGHLCALAALTAGDAAWQPGFESADTSVDACVPFYGVMDVTGTDTGSGKYGPGLLELLEDRVMKVKSADDMEVFKMASPTHRVHAGAPPFFVLHGTHDTLVPVEVARRFVEALRAVSPATVAYAELPMAQHAFDVLSSLRCEATTAAVVTFLEAVRAGQGSQVERSSAESD
jgi:acetyl esterase/lipase